MADLTYVSTLKHSEINAPDSFENSFRIQFCLLH